MKAFSELPIGSRIRESCRSGFEKTSDRTVRDLVTGQPEDLAPEFDTVTKRYEQHWLGYYYAPIGLPKRVFATLATAFCAIGLIVMAAYVLKDYLN